MKRSYFTFGIIGLLVLVAVMTNPGPDIHKEVVKDKINAYIQKSFNHDKDAHSGKWGQFGQAIGVTIGGVIVKNVVDNIVSTDNYILFSTTKLTWNGETTIIGIGIFGNVFLTGELDEMLNQGLIINKK